MNDLYQIAAEAWNEMLYGPLREVPCMKIDASGCIAIIKSAIEKATEQLSKERDDLAAALQRLIQSVRINLLCGIPEIKTVDDVIRGMQTVADKLIQVSESRAAHASEPLSDARIIIERGIKLMSTEQLGKWEGVRAWLEQTP